MYYNFILVLYIKRLVLKVIIVISVVFIAVSKWLKALLASFILIEIALLSIKSLKVVK